MESLMYFFTSSLVFLTMVTLTKHRILRYESYFLIFRVFVFLIKKHRKNDLKMQRATSDPKIDKKQAPSIEFGSENSPEFTSKRLKIPKLVSKSSFLTEPLFEYSLAWIWAGFWGPSLMDYVDRHRVPRIPAAQYIYRYIYIYIYIYTNPHM